MEGSEHLFPSFFIKIKSLISLILKYMFRIIQLLLFFFLLFIIFKSKFNGTILWKIKSLMKTSESIFILNTNISSIFHQKKGNFGCNIFLTIKVSHYIMHSSIFIWIKLIKLFQFINITLKLYLFHDFICDSKVLIIQGNMQSRSIF